MPVTVNYPGVYVEEIPSGVHTITGVDTSIAAFIGRAVMGPVDKPITINSFTDFKCSFGGLNVDYPMSYAVRDFYQNGGNKAVIVRLYKQDGHKTTKATIRIPGKDQAKPLVLQARTEGSWGNTLRARVDYQVSDEVAQKYGLTKDDLFNLTIRNMADDSEASFHNVSLKESPGRLDRVLAESARVDVPDAANMGFPAAHSDPDPGKSVWDDTADPATATSTKVVLGGADEAADSAALTDKADFTGSENDNTGMYALQTIDLFNLLCIPPDTRHGDTPIDVYQEALAFCVKRRAMLIVDAPAGWKDANDITANNKFVELGMNDKNACNAALYFPRVTTADPLRGSQLDVFVPCGMVAGVIARTDTDRGVWKAPAGTEATLRGIVGLAALLSDGENEILNSLGVNCLRSFPQLGRVVWGARTLRGANLLADEYKYVPVRRLALYIEASLYRGTQWVVFEPNDEAIWSQIRRSVGTFMMNLFHLGALQGQTPNQAYFVKCDSDTTTQNDIDLGITNIVVGFAPLKPAEFLVIMIRQIAGGGR